MAFPSKNKKISNELSEKLQKSASFKSKTRINVDKYSKSDSNQRHPTIAFIEKSDNEFKKLKTKIANEFQTHFSELLESENFADTLIIRGKYHKKVHICLLLTKIPELINKLLDLNINKNAFNSEKNEYSVKIPPEIKESELKLILKYIYSEYPSEDMQNEEKNLISKIEILSKNYIPNDNHDSNTEKFDSDSNIEQICEMNNELEELESYEDNEDVVIESGLNTSQMVRSGTFELLSSIYSEESGEKNIESLENQTSFGNSDENNETKQKISGNLSKESNEENSLETKEVVNKTSNSMFSLFIDLNEISGEVKQKERPKTNREDNRSDRRKGFDFIPLNNKSNVSHNQKRVRNSANPLLIRSLDSALPDSKVIEDIPLLPMSPIVKRNQTQYKKEMDLQNEPKNQNLIDRSIDKSSSDSFSEAFNECLNISVQSSSKNSYETDSIDILDENECKNHFHEDSDESISSDQPNDAKKDLDFDDSKTIRDLKSCSKLGEDLLKMFVQQISADIVIRVNDREIRAHKCILTARSRYFDAMLRGNWIESDTNYVDLHGFTYNSVYFALCHIYSGCLTLPPQIDLSELALLSDVLAMDSLKEIVVHELLVNRCHFFHTPCGDNCIVSIIKCLKLCHRSGLKDLYNKCLNWSAKHFTKVWANKAFTSLKPHLIDACFQTKVKQLLAENILKTTLECERLITATPRLKWAEQVFILLAKLIEECCEFISLNYDRVITSKDFLALGRGNSWDISNLEQTLLAAMTKLSPDVSCKALIELNKILLLQESDQMSDPLSYGPFNDQFARLVTKMQRYCERYMIQNANHVVHCQSWTLLPSEAQQKIRDGAVIVFEFEKPIAPPPKLSSRLINTHKKSNDSPNLNKLDENISKRVVPKHLPLNNKSKTNSFNKSIKVSNTKVVSDQHIYDTVPFENITSNKSKDTKIKSVSNKALNLHLKNRSAKEKVAKVSPFSVKTDNISEPKVVNVRQNCSASSTSSSKDLFAEIDAETSLVTYCLQEAELLEQELTRKIQKNQLRTNTSDNKRSTNSNPGSSIPPNSKSAANQSKEINARKTSSRSQSSSSVKARVAPRIQNQRK